MKLYLTMFLFILVSTQTHAGLDYAAPLMDFSKEILPPTALKKIDTNKPFINRVRYSDLSEIKSGDYVYVRQFQRPQPSLMAPFQIRILEMRKNYSLTLMDLAKSGREVPYRLAHILRTFRDDENFVNTLRKVGWSESQIMREFEKKGIIPLRMNEFEVSSSSASDESIFHLAELGLTKGIDSEFFQLGEQVYFPRKTKWSISYQEGTVVVIFANGDLLVRQGLETFRKKAEDIFSQKKNFITEFPKINTNILYTYKTPGEPAPDPTRAILHNGKLMAIVSTARSGYASPSRNRLALHEYNIAVSLKTNNPHTIKEKAIVIGAGPAGDILIFVPKLNTRIRIAKYDFPALITGGGTFKLNLVNSQVICSRLFK